MIKYIMRKIVLSLFALCCFSAVMAQQKTRSLSVELLGAQNIAGINYDSRFKGNSGLGYRVGPAMAMATLQVCSTRKSMALVFRWS